MGGGLLLTQHRQGGSYLCLHVAIFPHENKLRLLYFAVSFSRSLYVQAVARYFRPKRVVRSSESEKHYTIGFLVQQRSVTLPGRPARNYISDGAVVAHRSLSTTSAFLTAVLNTDGLS
jgi:hypothetical protein